MMNGNSSFEGKKLGKLRVTKRGRVYLEVGGQVIYLTHNTTGSLQEVSRFRVDNRFSQTHIVNR